MKNIEVILHATDGWDGTDWESSISVSEEEYATIMDLARSYEFEWDDEGFKVDLKFKDDNYAVDEYAAFTEHIAENAPKIYKKMDKEAEAQILATVHEDDDPDAYTTGFYFNLEWLTELKSSKPRTYI